MASLRFTPVFFLILLNLSCINKNQAEITAIENDPVVIEESYASLTIRTALNSSNLSQSIITKVLEANSSSSDFSIKLSDILLEDPYCWILVDKEHSLEQGYTPDDLVELRNASYRVNRDGLLLRRAAAASLEEMASEARADGITLTASSTYRSYDYQAEVYERNVRSMGQAAADRESARPGHSQHQLGLVVDFGSITDEFAQTREGQWLAANASRFGWSISYPDGYEDITGYRWESWHYRYTGRNLAEFIDSYFEGIQQHALRFIHEYKKLIE